MRFQRSYFIFTTNYEPLTVHLCNGKLAWVNVNHQNSVFLFRFNPLRQPIRAVFERPLTSVCGRSGRKHIGDETNVLIGAGAVGGYPFQA